ncbi:3-hydroxyacyl-CoA dehydrogenase family protein [Paenarthrobacter sp. MSM-2-10-13]|uniref:3-hydroxyacyl-CoA dehydrogenase family protein n=1 Tax=Paenarthrobacter sp. MSM-2-10-13 TaxID=2717318 RepID=UPI001420082C|nr:3-hydroxyacyl-CoA dehydrogenase family protein [Paenarthrobacter sp. MSM-2-10-13]NHW47476.1 3-hydroxyacyl-CoA dehydrogenase family protein [Paenarthrobacter sp. MSM-2-10-13]
MTQAPTIPNVVGVLGGGRMGAGIAHAFLTKGANVIVVERDHEAAAGAQDRVADAVTKSVARGTLNESHEKAMSRFSTSTDYESFIHCGLVVEAVPEDFDLKVTALKAVEEHLSADAYLASNTSSLSVTGLADELRRPANFVGLHFFNPVPASTLIEVVLGMKTSPELAVAAKNWTEALGKTAVVVNDAPGFASSRLGVAIALEAMRMVEEGVASAEDIDAAMVLGYKHPTGPLKTTDIVGLDVRLGIAEYLHATLGDRFAPPQILRDKVARGELGRKTGKGFFDWNH